MYVEHWESFRQQAEDLFRSRPLDTRYVLKYRNRDAKLVLKVTDNVQDLTDYLPLACWQSLHSYSKTLIYRECTTNVGLTVMTTNEGMQCFKFVTDQQSDLKKVEALNNQFFKMMSEGPTAATEATPMDTSAVEPVVAASEPSKPQKGQQQSRKSKRRG